MRRKAELLIGIVLLSGCGSEQIPTETTADIQPVTAATLAAQIAEHPDVAVLRRVTAAFHDFETATAAQYTVRLTECMEMPGLGGMGFHYGKKALIDGMLSVSAPEVLLYEPLRNGKLALVGVEYIVPYTIRSRDASPPILFGQRFKPNDVFQLWALHVWAWERNPSGLFADWNPQVTCKHAPVMTMAQD